MLRVSWTSLFVIRIGLIFEIWLLVLRYLGSRRIIILFNYMMQAEFVGFFIFFLHGLSMSLFRIPLNMLGLFMFWVYQCFNELLS